jgi:hypothetical protein
MFLKVDDLIAYRWKWKLNENDKIFQTFQVNEIDNMKIVSYIHW